MLAVSFWIVDEVQSMDLAIIGSYPTSVSETQILFSTSSSFRQF